MHLFPAQALKSDLTEPKTQLRTCGVQSAVSEAAKAAAGIQGKVALSNIRCPGSSRQGYSGAKESSNCSACCHGSLHGTVPVCGTTACKAIALLVPPCSLATACAGRPGDRQVSSLLTLLSFLSCSTKLVVTTLRPETSGHAWQASSAYHSPA